MGGTRAMPSGEIWGGNGPAAGALIGLTRCASWLASAGCWHLAWRIWDLQASDSRQYRQQTAGSIQQTAEPGPGARRKRDYPPPPAQAHFPEKAPRGAGAPPGSTPSPSPAPRAPRGCLGEAGNKTQSQGRPGKEYY
jgi:hypothetical protein